MKWAFNSGQKSRQVTWEFHLRLRWVFFQLGRKWQSMTLAKFIQERDKIKSAGPVKLCLFVASIFLRSFLPMRENVLITELPSPKTWRLVEASRPDDGGSWIFYQYGLLRVKYWHLPASQILLFLPSIVCFLVERVCFIKRPVFLSSR